jgi:Icc-related predicted phosphoesterase
MKLLFFADIHNDESAVDNIIKKVKKEKIDFLVCAGDLSEFGVGLKKLAKKLSGVAPLYIIPGNHEDDEEIDEIESKFKDVHNFHLKAVKIKDVLLLGCGGGGFSHKLVPFEESKKYFKDELKKLKDSKKAVLVTHAPPYRTKLDTVFGEHTGVTSIRKFIEKEQLALVICGHLHENSGKVDYIGKTKIVNPGKKGFIFRI